ncbi:MAG: hypothetical protein M3Q07_00560 [Pseudobdellovibrionaceae bacterium]|nr:hypothetical protein [Pseudobdellovibrionaceae bacterium]
MIMSKRRVLFGLSLVVFLFANSTSYANSLMSCENKGGYETNCFLSEYSLAPKTDIQRTFSIEYKMPCIGHEINVGILDQGKTTYWSLTQSNVTETLKVDSYGPLTTFDPDRAWTAGADFQVGCKLEITVTGTDLADTEKKRLNLVIDTIRSHGEIVDQVLQLASNATLLKGIIAQLDVNSIAAILADKYQATRALADSYEKQNKTEAAGALRSVQEDLRAAICFNAALAEQHRSICTEPSGESTGTPAEVKKTLTEKANEALTSLETNSSKAVKTAVDKATEVVGLFTDLVAYCSSSNASDATAKACPALKKLNIKTSACQ